MRVKIEESVAKSRQIAAELKKIALGTMGISEQSWNGAVIDLNETAEDWCDQYAWTNPTGVIEKPRLWIAELCLELTGTEDGEYRKRKKAISATTCGICVPKTGNAQEKLDKKSLNKAIITMKKRGQVEAPNSGNEEQGVPEKVQCEGFRFKPHQRCTNTFWRLSGGPDHCYRHR
jgi:hypothetical protein